MEILIIIIPIVGTVFGFATNAILEHKGYKEDWFLWGFFFGIIALIVAAARPEARPEPDIKPDTNTSLDELKALKELLDIGVVTQEEFDAKKKQLLNL